MNTLLILMVTTSNPDSFGSYAGMALLMLAGFIGLTLLFHGWPDWFKRRK